MIPGCPIFVYQMGRVASTAIVRSLEARGVPAHHGHFLHPQWHQSKRVDRFNDVEEAVETAHTAWLRYYLLGPVDIYLAAMIAATRFRLAA